MNVAVLFLCVANSARSQMAEALARDAFPDWTIQSAGSLPTRVHPLSLRVLGEIGVDVSGLESKSVDSIDLESVGQVVTLCAEEECPAYLGNAPRLDWSMPDPDRGDDDAVKLAQFREARDAIRARIQHLKP